MTDRELTIVGALAQWFEERCKSGEGHFFSYRGDSRYARIDGIYDLNKLSQFIDSKRSDLTNLYEEWKKQDHPDGYDDSFHRGASDLFDFLKARL